ncbi:MAG: hypothetical protein WA964_01325 [Ilumatobacter sp.]|uniref:single-stranded DNA-binding protein n=1 Tax=Ilumatobacter sp. TaxID=1967498 RepID=UPI003C70D6D7
MGINHNLVVLSGTVTLEPTLRELKNGVVLQFDVSTPLEGGATTSVPVAWHDPTTSQTASFSAGDDVVVTGTVRRRFFRVGGQTQSRTEVIVASLIPARRKKSADSALAAAAESIRP